MSRIGKNQATALEANILRAHRRRVMACHGVLDGGCLEPEHLETIIDNYIEASFNALRGAGCDYDISLGLILASLSRLAEKLRE